MESIIFKIVLSKMHLDTNVILTDLKGEAGQVNKGHRKRERKKSHYKTDPIMWPYYELCQTSEQKNRPLGSIQDDAFLDQL
jgi:hypothetical protein